MKTYLIKTNLIKENDDLFFVLEGNLKKNKTKLQEKDVLIVTSKVVALTEGGKIKINQKDIDSLIKKEVDVVLSSGPYALTIKDGFFTPNAGIDHSNTEKGTVILLPKNPQKSADNLRKQIKNRFHLKNFGVLICDSHCQPLRKGVTGLALAFSGFEGVEDLRGKKDLFGNKLMVTQRNLADQIASCAAIVMGESNESIPFVLIRDCPVKFTNRQIHPRELSINPRECLFNPLYKDKI